MTLVVLLLFFLLLPEFLIGTALFIIPITPIPLTTLSSRYSQLAQAGFAVIRYTHGTPKPERKSRRTPRPANGELGGPGLAA